MAQGVEIGHAAAIVAVGYAGGFQIAAEHRSRVLRPASRPYRQTGRLGGEIFTKRRGNVCRERLNGLTAILGVGSANGDSGGVRVQVKSVGRERGQFTGSEPRSHGH
jgi:hypothetical protein